MMRKEILVNGVWISIFAVAVILHILGINQPFLGNFAQHQTDYATIVQRWLHEASWSPFVPMMRFIGGGENRIFLGDIPLNISIVTVICQATGWSIEIVSRGLSAVFFFLSLYPFYRLVQMIFKDRTIVLWSMFFYMISPLTLIYGQIFLLEITGISLGLFGYYFFFRWYFQSSRSSLILSAFLLALMMGTRIYFTPLLLPLFCLFLKRYRLGVLKQLGFYLFFLVALSIPIVWQIYAGIAAQQFGMESSLQDNLRVFVFQDFALKQNLSNLKYFMPALEIVLSKLLTPIGIVMALVGVVFIHPDFKKQVGFLVLCLVSFIPIVILAPRKFVEFEYYYLPFVPSLAILAAMTLKSMEQGGFSRSWGKIILAICIGFFALRYSVAPILIIPDEDRYVLKAAEDVRQIVPLDARIIASHGSSTSFLYYTNRNGWALHIKEKKRKPVRFIEDGKESTIEQLEHYRSQGARYFALADKRQMAMNPSFIEYLSQHYTLIHESAHSLIYSLQEPI